MFHARESSAKTCDKILDDGFASTVAFLLHFFKKLMCRRPGIIPTLTEVFIKRIEDARFARAWCHTHWAFALQIFPHRAASKTQFRRNPMPTDALLVHCTDFCDHDLFALECFFRKTLLLSLCLRGCWSRRCCFGF